MGTSNRERQRAERESERERQGRGAAAFGFGERVPGEDEQVLELVRRAVQGLLHGVTETGPVAELIGAAASRRPVVERVLYTELESAVGQAWERGWQPAELVRATRRELGREAGALTVDLVIAEYRRYPAARVAPAWAAQVRGLGEPWWGSRAVRPGELAERHGSSRRSYVGTALNVLARLVTVAPLQVLLPLPGRARATESGGAEADPAKLAKVRALLAKAESTEFPEEAEALSARAQEMMVRHRIDHAALAAEAGSESEVGGRRLPVDAPYEQHKVILLNVVAQANSCRAVWHNNLGLCTVMGLREDINAVELLFTSLLVQATRAMQRAGSSLDAQGRSRTRSFRSSFLAAFAARIGERLSESVDSAERQVVHEYAKAGTDLTPVLASQTRKVEEALSEAFPELDAVSVQQPSNAQGWWAGRAAADGAALHTGQRVES